MDKNESDSSLELFKLGFEDDYWAEFFLAMCRLREEEKYGED